MNQICGLKGQQANSPGQRPGYGRCVALGYVLIAPSGRYHLITDNHI